MTRKCHDMFAMPRESEAVRESMHLCRSLESCYVGAALLKFGRPPCQWDADLKLDISTNGRLQFKRQRFVFLDAARNKTCDVCALLAELVLFRSRGEALEDGGGVASGSALAESALFSVTAC